MWNSLKKTLPSKGRVLYTFAAVAALAFLAYLMDWPAWETLGIGLTVLAAGEYLVPFIFRSTAKNPRNSQREQLIAAIVLYAILAYTVSSLSLVLITTAGLLFAVAYYLAALLVRELALRNLFWSLVEEGTARAFTENNRFSFAIMSYSGRLFAGDIPLQPGAPPLSQVDHWEVKDFPAGMTRNRFYLPLLVNIRWIGFPPFNDVYRYLFVWTSLEQLASLQREFKTSDKIIDYILLQSDVYASKVPAAECADNIPLDIVILVTGHVVNPYKALFRVERWLESSLNLIDAATRSLAGDKSYEELRKLKDSSANIAESLRGLLADTTDWIEKEWGFKTTSIRIHSVDPASKLAEEFIRATTQVYVAEQKKLADTAEGEGLAARDRTHLDAVSKITGGPEMFKWLQIASSKLTTYVDSNAGIVPTVPVGGQSQQAQPPAVPAQVTPTP